MLAAPEAAEGLARPERPPRAPSAAGHVVESLLVSGRCNDASVGFGVADPYRGR